MFIDLNDFYANFGYFSITYISDYDQVHSTSTVENDSGQWTRFDFTLDESDDGYIGVDFYSPRMYPKGCKMRTDDPTKSFTTTASLRIFMNGV